MSYILIQVAFFYTLELLFGCREKFIYVPAHLIGLLGRSLHDSLIARYRQLGQRDFSGIMPPVALPAVPGFLIVAGYRFLRIPDTGLQSWPWFRLLQGLNN